jgi:hypothetical protein
VISGQWAGVSGELVAGSFNIAIPRYRLLATVLCSLIPVTIEPDAARLLHTPDPALRVRTADDPNHAIGGRERGYKSACVLPHARRASLRDIGTNSGDGAKCAAGHDAGCVCTVDLPILPWRDSFADNADPGAASYGQDG